MRRAINTLVASAGAQALALAPAWARSLALRGPQGRVLLWAIFRLMERQVNTANAAGVDAVIHWEITGRSTERRQLVIDHGRASVSRSLDREPSLRITISDARFVELVTGIERATVLYTRGGLRIDGDLMLAARLQSLFVIPAPRHRGG